MNWHCFDAYPDPDQHPQHCPLEQIFTEVRYRSTYVLLGDRILIRLILVCRIGGFATKVRDSCHRLFFLFDQLLYSHGVFAAFIALLAMETENPNAANIAMRKLAVR